MLENLTELLLPALLLLAGAAGIAKKQDVYGGMLTGAQDGLRLMLSLTPTLVLMLTAVTMLRESGFFALLTPVFAPVFRLLGIPPEVAPLVLIRPLSGSAALAVGTDLMREYGVDSLIGRTAAVMLGSTETTFYTISVYFGAAGVKKRAMRSRQPDRRPDRLLHGRTERARVFPIAHSKRLPCHVLTRGASGCTFSPFHRCFPDRWQANSEAWDPPGGRSGSRRDAAG